VGLESHTVAAVSLEQLPGVVSVERKVDDINAPIRVSLPQTTPQVGVNRLVVHDSPAVSGGFPEQDDAKRAGRLRSTHHRTPIAHRVRCCEGAGAVSKYRGGGGAIAEFTVCRNQNCQGVMAEQYPVGVLVKAGIDA